MGNEDIKIGTVRANLDLKKNGQPIARIQPKPQPSGDSGKQSSSSKSESKKGK
jgi:hypothetical protein